MAQYKCSKCGATGYSKCAGQRSFFPDNQNEAVLSNLLGRKVEYTEVPTWDNKMMTRARVTLVYDSYFIEGEDKTEALAMALRTIRNMDQETIDQWVCSHKYELQSTKCDLGCCERKETVPT